jgi:anaerobic magnesium-protoporphyrin IX monomethyl ester cyclase
MNDLFENKSAPSAIALVALHAGYSHSSLALQSIASFAADTAFGPRIRLFESLVNCNPRHLLEQLVELAPVVVGFSTYLWNIQASLHLAGLLDQLLPETLIVLGGPEAGPRGEELLQDHPEIDFVIDGEGEKAFHDLLQRHLAGQGDLTGISGLVYRQGSGFLRNPVQPLPVECIPSPLGQGRADFNKPLIYWETSRGCPFRCSFCGSAEERLRAFPLERVEADLAVLEGLQNKVIKLLDRSFHLGKARTLKMLERFAATPEGLRFHLELNPDRISPEAMAIFRRAVPGKFQFEIGLQTLSEPVLQTIERQMQIPKALENIRELVGMARHPVHLDLIVGLPGEAAAQCRDSLNRVFALHAEHLQLGTLKLLPGTPLRRQAKALGYCWDRQPPYEVLSHPSLSFREIARFKAYAELLERLWNSGYLVSTLRWLVSMHYAERVTDCFDGLLTVAGESLVRDNLQPDRLFEEVCRFLLPLLAEDEVLRELLLWDYSCFSLVTGKTPQWISTRLQQSVAVPVAGSRRRLPVLELSERTSGLINQRRLQPLPAGRYAVWPRQHKKGTPVEIIPVDAPES